MAREFQRMTFCTTGTSRNRRFSLGQQNQSWTPISTNHLSLTAESRTQLNGTRHPSAEDRGTGLAKGPNSFTTSTTTATTKRNNKTAHPFPDDKFPRLVISVLESMKNRCPGRAGQFGEKTHLQYIGPPDQKRPIGAIFYCCCSLCGVHLPDL